MPPTLSEHWGLWTVFAAVILGVMALDLGVFHREEHEVSVKEALGWTAVWVVLGLGFNLLIWWRIDLGSASPEPLWPQYLTCYKGRHFFVVRDGRRYATPLFLTLLVVETTDILFARSE